MTSRRGGLGLSGGKGVHRGPVVRRIRTIPLLSVLVLLCGQFVACPASTPASASSATPPLPLTPANAARYFAEAMHDCRADGGHLWGVSLCGPMLFVDPGTRALVANRADAEGRLKPAAHGTFTGVMPADQIIANTSASWSGTRWIELLWPLPKDRASRDTLMAHESYHRVQARIVPVTDGGTNTQLDTLYGRYTIQLEWRALAAALQAGTDTARREAVRDALLFRAARYHRFPRAQAAEVALERNEGLAEYTGVMVGNATAAQRKAMALSDLRKQLDDPSFVRSFAYATGPAYGLLLDRYRPGWRKQITHDKHGPAAMLASALHLDLDQMSLGTVAARAARYGGPALLAAETARKVEHDRKVAHYRSLLVDGAVLVLPLAHPRKQFNPQNVLSLDGSGTLYPTLRVIDDWGTIDIRRGGLIAPDGHQLTVSAPNGDSVTGTIHGAGWTLTLAPGWRMAPAARKGDFTLRHGASGMPHGK